MLNYMVVKRQTWSGKPIIPYDLYRLKEISDSDGKKEITLDELVLEGWNTTNLLKTAILDIFPITLDGDIMELNQEVVFVAQHTYEAMEKLKSGDFSVDAINVLSDGEAIALEFFQAEDDSGAELLYRMKGYDGYER